MVCDLITGLHPRRPIPMESQKSRKVRLPTHEHKKNGHTMEETLGAIVVYLQLTYRRLSKWQRQRRRHRPMEIYITLYGNGKTWSRMTTLRLGYQAWLASHLCMALLPLDGKKHDRRHAGKEEGGNRQINQLRIIGLLKADFNTALKYFETDEARGLSTEQWGSRNNRNFNQCCNDQVIDV